VNASDNVTKTPIKRGFCEGADFTEFLSGELLVKKSDGLYSAEIIFKSDVLVGSVRVFVGQPETEKHAGNFKGVVHLSDEGNGAAFANKNRFAAESGFKRVNRFLKNRV
jgi:hypothetical protein